MSLENYFIPDEAATQLSGDINKQQQRCLKEILANCRSCNVMTVIISQIRYGGKSPESAVDDAVRNNCPEGLNPDPPYRYSNEWASFGMGQERREPFKLENRKPLFPKPGKGESGRKISKSKRNLESHPTIRQLNPDGWYQPE